MLMLANIWTTLLSALFVLVCLFMILVILIQKPKGGGLSGAFGGAGGGSQAVFGAKVGDFLTWFTVSLFVAFLLIAIAMVYLTRSEATTSSIATPPQTTEENPAGVDNTATPPATPEQETPEAPEAPAAPDASSTPATETPAAAQTPDATAPAAPQQPATTE